MSALGQWLGSWAGRWYGSGDTGEPPPRHTIEAGSVAVVVRLGSPTVGPQTEAPPAGVWVAPYIPPPHRVVALPVMLAPVVGRPCIGLRARPGSAAALAVVGRPLLRLRPMPGKPTAPKPDERLAELLREDDELMLMD